MSIILPLLTIIPFIETALHGNDVRMSIDSHHSVSLFEAVETLELNLFTMAYRFDDQQQRRQLLNIVDRGTVEQLFTFLQGFHRRPFQTLADAMDYSGVIDDQIDFIDCTGTKYDVTPLIIVSGKGSYEKTKILLVHGANPNQQCATGDTALNLAVHRKKYRIVDLLIQYHANPNISNQAGKTALHRAVVSYSDENINRIRTLLDAKADVKIEDRNQRTPLDEAVLTNRPEIIDVLLSHDRTLVEHAYRAAIIASRLGHNKCLEVLLNYGMNPNIADQTNMTPLHVAVRSLKLSTVRLLIANDADPNIVNNRGETAAAIAQYLPLDQQENFVNALAQAPQKTLSNVYSPKGGKAIPYAYPLLRSHANWTLDSDEFRSSTAENSSVQNLLDASNETYWHCKQSKNAWVIFDLKHEYSIGGVRIIGCDNQSAPKNGHLDVSNALNGPWLKVKDLTCLVTQGNKNDFLFSSVETRFIRVFISDNYGGEDTRIQSIGFFGLDTRLVTLLKEYSLENSLPTLLSNNINDLETLYENQDEILNSSDRYLHVNDHFQFIRLTESLRSPHLTFLEWFNPPQTTAIAGDKLHTFSVAADEGVTNRVKLEEQLENSPQANTILMRDLEPIQGRSLVDFPDYTIKQPGRYRIRVVSVESPDIHTPWQEIVVGSTLPYAHALNNEKDEPLYLSSTASFVNDTTSDKENTLFSPKDSSTSFSNQNNRAFVSEIYESEPEETGDDSCLISLTSIEDSPYNFSLTTMSHTTDSAFVDDRPQKHRKPDKREHYTQTKQIDNCDHWTNTEEDFDDGYISSSRLNSKPSPEIYLTPTRYRSTSRTPLSNIFPYSNTNSQKQSDDYDLLNYVERIITPTKYRLLRERANRLRSGGYTSRPQALAEPLSLSPQRLSHYGETPRQYSGRRNQLSEEPARRKQQQQQNSDDDEPLNYGERIIIPTKYRRDHARLRNSPSYEHRYQHRLSQNGEAHRQQPGKRTQSIEDPTRKKQHQHQQQSQHRPRHQSHQQHGSPRGSSPEEQLKQQSQNRSRRHSQQRSKSPRRSSPEEQQKHQSHHRPRHQSGQRSRSPRDSSPEQEQPSHYYELNQSQNQTRSREVSPAEEQRVQRQQQKSSSQKRTDADDESVQSRSEYYGQGPSQNRSRSSPTPRQEPPPPYESKQRTRPQSKPVREPSTSQERQQQRQSKDYYELELSPKSNEPVRDLPAQQKQRPSSSRKRTDSDDESSQPDVEYYGQAQSQSQNRQPQVQRSSSPPPPREEMPHESRQKTQPQSRPAREPSSRQEQQQQRQSANYYEEIISPPRSNEPARQSPARQQQSNQRNNSELRTPPSSQIKQPIQKRNTSEYDSPNVRPTTTNRPLRPRIDSDDKSASQRHQHQTTLENMEQRTWRPPYDRYRVIVGDVELIESPSDTSTNPNQSKSGQMQLIFRATLQGEKDQDRAQNAAHDSDNDEYPTQMIFSNIHRTSHPNSHQSPIIEDRQNGNLSHGAYQNRSSHHTQPSSHRDQLTPERHAHDYDKHTRIEGDPSRQLVSSPNASRTNQSHTDSHRYPDDHSIPSNRNSHAENKDDIDGIHERSRSSSQNRKSSKYEPSPLKKTDRSRSSPLLVPSKISPKSSDSKSKYFFGDNIPNPASDDDSDEAVCEMFGHNSQPKTLADTTAKRSLDYSSAVNSRAPMLANQNSGSPQFEQQTDIGTAIGNSLTQRSSSSPSESTVRKAGDSLTNTQTYSPNRQTSVQTNYETADRYPLPSNIGLNQNFSNASTTGFPSQYPGDSDHYEPNLGMSARQQAPAGRSNQNQYNPRESPDDDDDDPDRDNDDPVEYDDDPHDRIPDNPDSRHNSNDDDDENDNIPRDDDSPHTITVAQSGLQQLVQQNPVRDAQTGFKPIQYPPSPPSTATRPAVSNPGQANPKKGGGFFSRFSGSKNQGGSTQNKPIKPTSKR